jgi:hypothetical protein
MNIAWRIASSMAPWTAMLSSLASYPSQTAQSRTAPLSTATSIAPGGPSKGGMRSTMPVRAGRGSLGGAALDRRAR